MKYILQNQTFLGQGHRVTRRPWHFNGRSSAIFRVSGWNNKKENVCHTYGYVAMATKIWFHFRFPCLPQLGAAIFHGCKIGFDYKILISTTNYAIIFVIITSSIMLHCHFENSQSLAQDKLLASRVMICSHSSFFKNQNHTIPREHR